MNEMRFRPRRRLKASQLNQAFASERALSEHEAAYGLFQQNGAGAVESTVHDQLLPFVRPEQFGAVGDGVTDDTAAIQAAIDYAKGSGTLGLARAKVLLSGKTYRHTGLVIDRALVIEGEGSSSSVLQQIGPATGPAIRIAVEHDGTDFAANGHPVSQVQLRNLRIRGTGSTDAAGLAAEGDGIRISEPASNRGRPHVTLDAVTVYDCARDGLNAEFFDWGSARLIGFGSHQNGRHGINCNSCQDWQIFGGGCGGNTKYGVLLAGVGQFVFFGTNIWSSGEYNAYLFDGGAVGQNYFWGCSFDRAVRHGIYYDVRGGRRTVFHGCYFQVNSSGNPGLYSDIYVAGGVTSGLRLADCWFQKAQPADAAKDTKLNIEFAGSTAVVNAAGTLFDAGDGFGAAGVTNREASLVGAAEAFAADGETARLQMIGANVSGGGSPTLYAYSATDTDVGVTIQAKGSRGVTISSDTLGTYATLGAGGIENRFYRVGSTTRYALLGYSGTGDYAFLSGISSSAPVPVRIGGNANQVEVTGAASGIASVGPTIAPNGSDAHSSLLLRGKGTGGVQVAESGGRVAFYGAVPAVQPTITGSRGGNAALASLLTQLATLGLITDSTSA